MKALIVVSILMFATGLVNGQFTCNSMGLFPDPSSTDCSTYFACVITDGVLVSVPAVCPGGTIFHWVYSGCVPLDAFVCPNTPEPTTLPPTEPPTTLPPPTEPPTTLPPTTQAPTTAPPPTEPPTTAATTPPVTPPATTNTQPPPTQTTVTVTQPPVTTPTTSTASTTTTTTTTTRTTTTTTVAPRFTCPARGNFGDEESLDCSTFHQCSNIGDLPTVGRCNGNTIFDWRRRTCTSANQFMCAMASDPFVCPGSGDWPNPNSPDCSTYFQCFMNWDARVMHQTGICQGNTAFDWDRRQCISRNQANCRA